MYLDRNLSIGAFKRICTILYDKESFLAIFKENLLLNFSRYFELSAKHR